MRAQLVFGRPFLRSAAGWMRWNHYVWMHQSSQSDLRRRRHPESVRTTGLGSHDGSLKSQHGNQREFFGCNGYFEYGCAFGRALVGLSSSNSFVTVPSSVTVPEG